MSEEPSNRESGQPLDPSELRHLKGLLNRAETRRAYAKLLRRFSPETHPAEFQQIRAAYEAALQRAEWRERSEDAFSLAPEPMPESPIPPAGETGPATNDATALDASQTAPDPLTQNSASPNNQQGNRESSLRQDLQSLWTAFSDAPDSFQVADVQKLCDAVNTIPEAFLMRYWMEKLRPDPGFGKPPYQFLLEALKRVPEDSRFHRLLAQELEEDFRSTAFELLAPILEVMRNPRRLANCLNLRWSIVAERSDWTQLHQEIEQVRARLAVDHQRLWIELLLTVYEYVIFSADTEGEQLLRVLTSEIETAVDVQNWFRRELEFCDVLLAIRRQSETYGFADNLSRLVTSARHSARTTFRKELFEIVSRWVGAPAIGLSSVSRLEARFPDAFWLFRSYLHLLNIVHDNSIDQSPGIRTALASRLNEFLDSDYVYVRQRFLEFCRDECLRGAHLLEMLREKANTEPRLVRNIDLLQSDKCLLVITECIFAFLSAC